MIKTLCHPSGDGHYKTVTTHILAASLVGVVAAAVVHHRRRRQKHKPCRSDQSLIPHLDRTESGRLGNLERFSHYVARQMGFEDYKECPNLCKLAYDYLKKTKGSEDNIYEFFASEVDKAESLSVKLIEELERCILTYFAFHWNQAPIIVSQVLNSESEKKPKLKDAIMAATRKQRFERVSRSLKVTRFFSTLVDEMKAIKKNDQSHCTEVMVPVALSERSPVLLLMGGGMGAGKSTVAKDILKESFWAEAAANAVVVEADAFKESDVLYRALSSSGHHDDMLQTAELVHQSSTNAASSVLVTALNEGRDIIMDGTLSWEPFVEQTIEMARNVHKYRYRMGDGYRQNDDGTVTEKYWERVEENDEHLKGCDGGEVNIRNSYRIELVGVVCDAYLAVVRGIRRAIITGRAVRVNSQLRSHQRFAIAFPKYCQLVDNARLYCTNRVGGSPQLIAWKDGDNKLLVDPEDIKCLEHVGRLNADADSVHGLYPDPNPIDKPGSVWKDIILSPSRPTLQAELKAAIQKIEADNPLSKARSV